MPIIDPARRNLDKVFVDRSDIATNDLARPKPRAIGPVPNAIGLSPTDRVVSPDLNQARFLEMPIIDPARRNLGQGFCEQVRYCDK
jgi:hypothetical protein